MIHVSGGYGGKEIGYGGGGKWNCRTTFMLIY